MQMQSIETKNSLLTWTHNAKKKQSEAATFTKIGQHLNERVGPGKSIIIQTRCPNQLWNGVQ